MTAGVLSQIGAGASIAATAGILLAVCVLFIIAIFLVFEQRP